MSTLGARVEAKLKEVNNALLDLQVAGHQTFPRPLRHLAKALRSPELEAFNRTLPTVDLETFLKESRDTQSSMVGSASLLWPDDRDEEIALTLAIIDKCGEDPNWAIEFSHDFYYAGSTIVNGIHEINSQLLVPFARDYRAFLERAAQGNEQGPAAPPPAIGQALGAVPASDRIVRIDHNSSAYRDAVAALDEVERELANVGNVTDAATYAHVKAELSAGRTLFQAPQLRPAAVGFVLGGVLTVISVLFPDFGVSIAANAAWALVVACFKKFT